MALYITPGTVGLLSAAQTFQEMGIRIIRQGGSFADDAFYFWKRWRGRPWERPSLGAEWSAGEPGEPTIVSGWGPFEMADFCAALGIEHVLTTNAVGAESPQDMADLVEYMLGGANTTWGALQIHDGHPYIFKTRFIELGAYWSVNTCLLSRICGLLFMEQLFGVLFLEQLGSQAARLHGFVRCAQLAKVARYL